MSPPNVWGVGVDQREVQIEQKKMIFDLKKFLILLLIILSSVFFGKGAGGVYKIEGTMYSKEAKKIISNAVFTVNKINVKTDAFGNYKVEIAWDTQCPSDLNFFKRRIFIKNSNPKYIVFNYENKEIKIRNKWKKYGRRYSLKINKKNYHKNLYW